jgi:calcineurin-like phosphoesterase family protein
MDKLRFVVLGDSHFCTWDIRGEYEKNCSLAEMPDYARYAHMMDEVLKPMFEKVKALKPEFVISTGDFVEGGMAGNRDNTYSEMQEGWEFMQTLDCPCFIAKGTHEGSGDGNPGAEAYRDIVMSGLRDQTGLSLEKEYFRLDKGDCSFFILDYLGYLSGGEQDKWLEAGLKEASENKRRIFIAAHPPLYNWGRHFFNEPEFINRIIELCNQYPVDSYFCGHTHNQCASFHKTSGNRGFLQLMASSVGYPEMGVIALDDFHSLAEFSGNDKYLWGIHEDSAPGFYLVEIDGEAMKVKWISSKGDEALLAQEKRRALPQAIVLPEYKQYKRSLSQSDVKQIKGAWLHIYGLYSDEESTEVCFNGISLGNLPVNCSYAARRYFTLNDKALQTIRNENHIEIKLPSKGDFAIGSVSLEFILWDNTIIRSEVASELFITGECWKEFPQPRQVTKVLNGEKVSFLLNFKS